MSRVSHSTRSRRRCAVTTAAVAIETLEFRRLLSCDVDVYGDTLIVKGDKYGNEISITEENDIVVVTCDGDAETISGGASIDKVIVKAGKGNDEINVNLEDDDGDLERVYIDGGDGHDEITLIIGEQPLNGTDVTATPSGDGGGGDWSGYNGEDDLEVDITGGSGNDTINVQIALFRGLENNGPLPHLIATSHDGDEEEEENGDGVRGLELDIDGGSGHDTINARVLVINIDNDFGLPSVTTSGSGNSGADGGDGDGNIDIEIDGGSGNDDINLQVVAVNLFDGIATLSGGSYGGGGGYDGGGGNEEDLEIDIDGGSGDDSINVDIQILNQGILVPFSASGAGYHDKDDNLRDVDLDLDIDGGSGHDDISVQVNTTPYFLDNDVLPLGVPQVPSRQFSDIEITIDGEGGNDSIDVSIDASGGIIEAGDATPGGLIPVSGPDLPLFIDLEGGSGNDDIALSIDANGANLVPGEEAHGKHPFVRLEGESGNDDLTLLVFGVSSYDDLDKAFLLHGGSGHDTCTTNVPEDAVKVISCEDEGDLPV